MGNKEREVKCLQETMDYCSRLEGETRRILQRLSLERCINSERPDFMFEIPPNRRGNASSLVGLEHFMVDQCCESQRNQKRKGERVNSLSVKRRSKFGELCAEYVSNNGDLSNELINEFLDLMDDVTSDHLSTSYPELVESLSTTFLRHLSKVSEYRENINKAKTFKGKRVEIGFLIEMHFDMSQYLLVSEKEKRRCEPGDIIIITSDMVDIFSEARGKVDFIILSMYGNVDIKPRNVFAFKCDSLKKSITKQNIPICVYAGRDADFRTIHAAEVSKGIGYSQSD